MGGVRLMWKKSGNRTAKNTASILKRILPDGHVNSKIDIKHKAKIVQTKITVRLRELRKKHHFTMLQVANYIGKQQKAYQAYEEGRAEPSLASLIKLKEMYGFKSIDDLLSDKRPGPVSAIEKAYLKANLEKRRIVDFVLGV